MIKDQRKLIFFHIPKTAGTSLRKLMIQNFDQEEVAMIYPPVNFKKGVKEFVNNRQKIAFGHFGWDSEFEQLLEQVFKISFLRNPVQRVISHYFHFKNHKSNEYEGFTFDDFLKTKFARNWQSRRLGGGFFNEGLSDKECYTIALENVLSHFDFIGITDEMDISLLVLSRLTGMDLHGIKRMNINLDKHFEEAFLKKYGTEIERVNQYDELLYQAGVKRLREYP